jgi:tol-pal system protein YbgF
MGYVKNAYPPHMSPAMIRFVSPVVALVACTLCAGSVRAQVSDADLVTRIGRLEVTIRELTGHVEQLQYRNQQLEQQVQHLQEEATRGEEGRSPPRAASSATQRPAAQNPSPPYSQPPYSPPPVGAPPAVAAQVSPAPLEPPPASSGGRRGDAFDPSANPTAPGAPRQLGTSTAATEPPPPVSDAPAPGTRQIGAPLDLSTPGAGPPPGALPPPPPSNPSSTGAMQQATLPPTNSPKDQYDLAYGYVLHKDYALAADSFRGFLHQYPSDRLAPEAQYWLGESLFQQQQYRDAAESFLAVSTKYETTARAPEALLRLGQSLAALGEKEAACASLGEVLRKYPRATSSVKQAVDREQKRGHC